MNTLFVTNDGAEVVRFTETPHAFLGTLFVLEPVVPTVITAIAIEVDDAEEAEHVYLKSARKDGEWLFASFPQPAIEWLANMQIGVVHSRFELRLKARCKVQVFATCRVHTEQQA